MALDRLESDLQARCREEQHHPSHRDRAQGSPKPQHYHQIFADLLLAAPLQGTPRSLWPRPTVKPLAKVEVPTPNWELGDRALGTSVTETSREEEQQHELKTRIRFSA